MTASCRWRSSTTSSAAARRSRSRVDGRRSLIYLMDQVRARRAGARDRRAGHARPRSTSRASSSSSSPPTRRRRESLRRCSRTLGFSQAGTPQAKDVTLYRQGDINIVDQHRARGACALLLRRPRHLRLCHRAQGRGRGGDGRAGAGAWAPKSSSSRSAGRARRFPAIRGVGGGVIYFIDARAILARVWDIEFEPVADDAARDGAGLTRDRPCRARPMNYDEMLTWLLFYTSIFRHAEDADGRRHRSRRHRAQPGRSRATTARLRLTLNGAENRQHARRPFHRRDLRLRASSTSPSRPTTFSRRPQRWQAQWLRGARDLAQLLRRPRSTLRARTRPRRPAAGREHPLRPRRARRVLPALQPDLRRGLLLRDRRAARRLPRLWRAERALPHRRAEARHGTGRHASKLRPPLNQPRREIPTCPSKGAGSGTTDDVVVLTRNLLSKKRNDISAATSVTG